MKLTVKQYQTAISDLYHNPSRLSDKEIEKQELNLTIDHRLGTEFEESRRESLWCIKQNLNKNFLKLSALYLIQKITQPKLEGETYNVVMKQYSKVLTSSEMKDYFEQ